MKKGIIFYVKSYAEIPDMEELKQRLKSIFPEVDDLEIALSPNGEDDILHAWWRLTVKGIKQILLRFVEIGEKKDLKTGLEMRLVG